MAIRFQLEVPKCFVVTFLVLSMALLSPPTNTEGAGIKCYSCSASTSNRTELDQCLKGNKTGSEEEVCDGGCATIMDYSYSGGSDYDVEKVKKGCLEGSTKVLMDCLWESCGHQGECMMIRTIDFNHKMKVEKCYKDSGIGTPYNHDLTRELGDNDQPSSQRMGRDIPFPVVGLCQCNHEDHCNEFTHHASWGLDCPNGKSPATKASAMSSNTMVAVVIFSGFNLVRGDS